MDADIIGGLVKKTTGKWAKQRKAEERDFSAAIRRAQAMRRTRRVTVKEAAWEVMADAYRKASAGGTLPAAARQIMYAGRGAIQEMTGKTLNDQYFCQTLLPDYMAENPDETADWDVVFDARGNFSEPHTGKRVPLGTVQVRSYLFDVKPGDNPEDDVSITLKKMYPTAGPSNRFGAILFLEKEGFAPLLEKVKLAERYDVAIMSTKGLSVTAARHLVDELCAEYEVPLLIARDFDKAGFSIAGTLQNDTRRYEFANAFEVVDIGLRLEDVEAWGLESEDVSYGKTDPTWNLRDNGATPEEIAFLYHGHDWQRGHHGRRVELNAFTSDKFVEWLEAKLQAHDVKKVVPDEETLAAAYRRSLKMARIEAAIDEIADEDDDDVVIPDDLRRLVTESLQAQAGKPWDDAIAEIAERHFDETSTEGTR